MAPAKLPPPEIDGYQYVGHIGSGGYSEVFEYRDDLGRQVAVKVLTEDASDAEARAMASVSVHSAIVDVFKTDLTAGGLRYLVMPYFGGPTYADLLRDGALDVAEVLSVGVQMAGALEFAHQNGLLHRDVKPANILTNDLGRPGLSDFGIAARHDDHAHQKAVSLPWAPPEVLEDRMPDARSDVYALAATLFTLLEGHAPFVQPGGDNSDRAVTARTVSAEPPTVQRSDVPRSLNSLLRRALAKEPAERPTSAEEFGRALQAVESELGLSQTGLEVAGRAARSRRQSDSRPFPSIVDTEGSERTELLDPDATKARAVRVIRSEPADDHTRRRDPGGGEGRSGSPLIAGVPVAPAVGGLGRARPTGLGVELPEPAPERGFDRDPTDQADAAQTRRSRRQWIASLVVAGLLVGVGIAVYRASRDNGKGPECPDHPGHCDPDPGDPDPGDTTLPPSFLPEVSGLTVTRTAPDSVQVAWKRPDDKAVIGFTYQRCDDSVDRTPVQVDEPVVNLAGVSPGSGFCIDVVSRSADGRVSDAVRGVEGE